MTRQPHNPETLTHYCPRHKALADIPGLIKVIEGTFEVAFEQEQILIDAQKANRSLARKVTRPISKSLKLQLQMADVTLVLVEKLRNETLTMDQHFDLTHLTEQCQKLKELATRVASLLNEPERRPRSRAL